MRPDAWALRDLVSTGELPPVIEVFAPNGKAETITAMLAAALNCEAPVHRGPCGACGGCRDAFSGGSLAIIWVDAVCETARDLGKLRKYLMAWPLVRRQLVVVREPGLVRGKKTSAALGEILKKVPCHTTVVLITTGEAAVA
jgi:hypothetical protein